LEIATVAEGGHLDLELKAISGRGYVPADMNKTIFTQKGAPSGLIYIDSIFTPITKVTYKVDSDNFKHGFHYEKLELEVNTNGSIDAEKAVALAAKLLDNHLSVLTDADPKVKDTDDMLKEDTTKVVESNLSGMTIEDLSLSVRSFNCLRRANISTVEELTQKSEEEMMKVRNLGRKSLNEVKTQLEKLGLHFRTSE